MVGYAIKTPPQHGTWQEYLDVWRAADEAEVYESAWNFDHFYPLTEPLDGTCLEGWTMLAALAQATTRIRIGSMVNGMHYRHPAVTANMAVTLDHISGGRFMLGLGAGWMEPESEAYGMPLGTIKERCDRFDEGVEVIKMLMSQDHTNFDGEYYQLVNARCEPKPIQDSIPIVIGAKGKKRTLKTVAKFADHWDTTFPADTAAWQELSDVVDAHCADIGRDPSEIRRSIHLALSQDSDLPALVDQANEFGEAGVDLVVFSMRNPYRANEVTALAEALSR